jgi:hypothetical protein
MASFRRQSLRRWITWAVIAAAIVVAVLVALVAGGVLVLFSNSPTPVTISSVHLVIQEDNTSSGVGWFGPWSINYTQAEGFPIQVAPGNTFSIVWENVINFDSVPHSIYRVTSSPPFTIASTLPALAHTVPQDSGDFNLAISVGVPSSPGGTYAVTLVVDCITAS